jgi:hypothetical protein
MHLTMARVGAGWLSTLALLVLALPWVAADWPCSTPAEKFWPGLRAWTSSPSSGQGPACVRVTGPGQPWFPRANTTVTAARFLAASRQLCTYAIWGGRLVQVPGPGTLAALVVASRAGPGTWAGFLVNVTDTAEAEASASAASPSPPPAVLFLPTSAVLDANGSAWRWQAGDPTTLPPTVGPRVVLRPGLTSASDYVLVLAVTGAGPTRAARTRVLTLSALLAAARSHQVRILCQAPAPVPCPRGFLLHTPDPPGTQALPDLSAVGRLHCLGAAPPGAVPTTHHALQWCNPDGAEPRAHLLAADTQGLQALMPALDTLTRATTNTSLHAAAWWTGARATTLDADASGLLQLRWPSGLPVTSAESLPGFAGAAALVAAGTCDAAAAVRVVVNVTAGPSGLQVVVDGAHCSPDPSVVRDVWVVPPGTVGALCQWDLRLRLQPGQPGRWNAGYLVAYTDHHHQGQPPQPTYMCTVEFAAGSGAVACREMGYDAGLVLSSYYNNDGGARIIWGRGCLGWEPTLDACGDPGTRTPILSPALDDWSSTAPCVSHDAVAVACFMRDAPQS